jgi:cytidylate kinase
MTIVDQQQQQQLHHSNIDNKTIMSGRLSIWMAIHPEVVVVTMGEVEF